MRSHDLIDWIAFTVPIEHSLDVQSYQLSIGAYRALGEFMGPLWDSLVALSGNDDWELRNGRSPYSQSYYNGHGLTVYVGARSKNVLVEITGRGCEWLRSNDLMQQVIECAHTRMSRIDVATDIESGVSPTRFVAGGYSSKFRSAGMVTSESGETCYIGSKKSERFCRVYRYAEPHPRAKYLRVEYVFRKKSAKALAESLCANDVREVADSASVLYQWGHELMKEKKGKLDMKVYRPERPSGKTLRWIISQVAPAFKKLVKEGAIENPERFLMEYFLESKGDEDEG